MAIEQKPGDLEKQKPAPSGMPEAQADLKLKKGDDKMGAEDEEPQDASADATKKPN